MLAAEGVALSDALSARADEFRRAGQTVVFVAADGAVVGLLGIADPIKPTTPDALRELRAAGLRVVMLTGDSGPPRRRSRSQLGIDEVIAEVLP
jgi:Cu+-exporting ATPase